ncbi:hypothetical protein BBFL7_00846 [Flavobacteria bacterium BBFL7]|nr:hypothetical protein BBFL7_00846 [Flavobacteria bacterium BBFL7]
MKEDEQQKILRLHHELLQSQCYVFPYIGKVNVSLNQGVYIVYDNNNIVLHVGKTNGARNGLNQRLQDHVCNRSSFSKLYMQLNKIALRGWGKFQFIEIADARERSLLEALSAGLLCPKHIGTGEKKSNK